MVGRRAALRVTITFACLLALIACGKEQNKTESNMRQATLTSAILNEQQIQHLQKMRIFFGHQSVGDNILDGVRDLMAEDPDLRLNLVSSANPESVAGPAFIEAHIGTNRNPASKTSAFNSIMAQGMGAQGGVALYKYCYIDFGATTDVQQVFENYKNEISNIERSYPALKIVHVTVPLTVEEQESSVTDKTKTAVRRVLGREPNIKRNEFNRLLKETYGGSAPLFDLAEVESTHADRTRSYYSRGFEKVYTLAPEWTTDGGHLNEAGRRIAAQKLLQVVAAL
jgi:hypothetical protein